LERNNRTRSSMSIVWIGKGLENMQRRMDAGDNLIAQKKSAFSDFQRKSADEICTAGIRCQLFSSESSSSEDIFRILVSSQPDIVSNNAAFLS